MSLVIDLLKRVFGPSLRVLHENRNVLRRALWIRTRHPRIWRQIKREDRLDRFVLSWTDTDIEHVRDFLRTIPEVKSEVAK